VTFGGRLLAGVMGHRPAVDWRDLPRARRLLPSMFAGLPNLVAAASLAGDGTWRGAVAFAGGLSLAVYVLTEMALLRTVNFLQVTYVVIALIVLILAERLHTCDRSVSGRARLLAHGQESPS
jgi:hypothetical protein